MDSRQTDCVKEFSRGKNIFLTGSAGTGKSFMISQLMSCGKQMKKYIGCTAMTGNAAILLGSKATTLHSYTGIGLGKDSTEKIYERIKKNKKIYTRWRKMDVLIIDEVSMLGPELFIKLESLGRIIRKNERPFGGIQLVLVGDFFQLPPVEEKQFLFESPLFEKCIEKKIVLKTVYRQKKDQDWFDILQNIRIGNVKPSYIDILKERVCQSKGINRQEMTCLYSLNRKVNTINHYYLHQLGADIKTFTYQIHHRKENTDNDEIESFLKTMNILTDIELCVNAKIILTWNIDIENELVNGSQGEIMRFSTEGNPIVKFKHVIIEIKPIEYIKYMDDSDEEIRFCITQLPLRLSWALSIHKMQGQSIDEAYMDLGNDIFEYGQIYVALSRIKTLNGVYLSDFNHDKIKVNPKVLDFYQTLE